MRGVMTKARVLSQAVRRLRRDTQRGAAAVEFALVLVPMLLLAFGVAEYGRAIYHYNTLVKSVRSGVRLLSMYKPADTNYRTDAVARAKCMVVYANETCSGNPVAPSLAVSHVRVCDNDSWSECSGSTQSTYKDVASGEGPIQLVEVRITGYQYPFMGLPLVTSSATTTFSDIKSLMRQGP